MYVMKTDAPLTIRAGAPIDPAIRQQLVRLAELTEALAASGWRTEDDELCELESLTRELFENTRRRVELGLIRNGFTVTIVPSGEATGGERIHHELRTLAEVAGFCQWHSLPLAIGPEIGRQLTDAELGQLDTLRAQPGLRFFFTR